MSKFIIIQKVSEDILFKGIMDLDDVVLCDEAGEMKHFPTKNMAQKYLKDSEFHGQIVKINLSRANFS